MSDKLREFNEITKTMRSLEQKGEFNRHVFPVRKEGAKPVTESFPYIPKGLLRLKYAILNFFIVRPLRWYQSRIVFKIKIKGKHHLKGVRSAIVTSNHIAIYDCLTNSFALKGHRLKIIAAEFNNISGLYGESMRAHGMLPLSSKYKIIKKFNNAVEHYLLYDSYVLIYPEESMWPMYDKPRPFKNGAFHYAARFDVPVIPIFITLRDSGKKNKDGLIKKYFTINICKPVYPKHGHSISENTEYLREAVYKSCVDVYETAYGKKLSFDNESLPQ